MSNRRSWLLLAESTSIAASVVGAAVAVVIEQVIYGLAPISLSLLLNLVNRRRLAQQIQTSTANRTQVEQLRRTVDSLSAELAQVQQNVGNLASRQELSAIVSTVEALNEQQKGLRLSLKPIPAQLNDLSEQFNHRPELEQIESLAGIIIALKQNIDEIPKPDRSQQPSEGLQEQTEAALAQLSHHCERVEGLEKAIARIQQQLTNLQH